MESIISPVVMMMYPGTCKISWQYIDVANETWSTSTLWNTPATACEQSSRECSWNGRASAHSPGPGSHARSRCKRLPGRDWPPPGDCGPNKRCINVYWLRFGKSSLRSISWNFEVQHLHMHIWILNSLFNLLKFAMIDLNVVRLLKISVGEIAGDVDIVGFILTAHRSQGQCLVECGSGIEHHPGEVRAFMRHLKGAGIEASHFSLLSPPSAFLGLSFLFSSTRSKLLSLPALTTNPVTSSASNLEG